MLEAGIITAAAGPLLAFYRDGFGFELDSTREFPQGTVHRMRRGDAHIKLYQPAGGARPAPRPEPWHAEEGLTYAALHVDDAAAVLDQAVRAGASVLVEVTAHRPGARFALITDPQGNVWELLEER